MHTSAQSAVAEFRPADSAVMVQAGITPEFCRTCALSSACAMVGYGRSELSPLYRLMEHLGPYRAGETVFAKGEAFAALYAVRAGVVKTRVFGKDGQEHVLGFHLPGEVIGLEAIHPGRFPCDAVALDDAQLCRYPFAAMSQLAAQQPQVQRHLFRLLSQGLGVQRGIPGEGGADERIATFLLDLGDRLAVRGQSGTRFRLGMSRNDIANYLCLAAETVSRTLSRFRSQGLIDLDGRALHLREVARLRELGQHRLAA